MNLVELKCFLKKNICAESKKYFGVTDDILINQITNNWFNDKENYDGRWKLIGDRVNSIGKVLDMAAGCGTFVLNGLQNGYDVHGVEPEEWKREYFQNKIVASNYQPQWKERIICAVGESLPFDDECFDLITSYQTLEHVQDVNMCIQEMLRVLKRGGILYIRAPDYNCFFEPHYRIPFLPKMNKVFAALYLDFLGRPSLGLDILKWTTEKDMIKFLHEQKYILNIKRTNHFYSADRKAKILKMLPCLFRSKYIVSCLNKVYETKLHISDILMIGRREKHIDLWIIKIE
jgi:ubiquinone/menaquinone biosynthesis C-methylase UbiE